MKNKRGQVWVETVTYTLVAFVLIGLVLGFAKPKVEELQDKAVIEQSIKMMQDINAVILEIQEKGIGNKRKLEINIRKGELEINSINDSIVFYFEGNYMYSQPGIKYSEGGLEMLTEEYGKNYIIIMEKNYTNLNLTYGDKEENKKLMKASTPYVLFISNKGGANQVIDFELN